MYDGIFTWVYMQCVYANINSCSYESRVMLDVGSSYILCVLHIFIYCLCMCVLSGIH